MRFSREEKRQISVDITPLIDVVFLLLIFFMVSTTFIYSNSIDVNLPAAKGDEKQINDSIRIVLTKDGEITINGKPFASEAVQDELVKMKETIPDTTVIIEADTEVPHGQVVHIMDASRLAGYQKFAIAVEEEGK
ncbi:MAG: ExbD/TolR family protein [Deferribacterales bacterium]